MRPFVVADALETVAIAAAAAMLSAAAIAPNDARSRMAAEVPTGAKLPRAAARRQWTRFQLATR